MGVVHGGGWFIRSSHVELSYSPKPRIYFIHYAFVGAEPGTSLGQFKPTLGQSPVPLALIPVPPALIPVPLA